MGVFTTRVFRKGEIVVVGTVEKHNQPNTVHSSQTGQDSFVLYGHPMPIVNHSCDPNCGLGRNMDGVDDLVAMRDIPEGVEVTYDYAMRNHRIEHFPSPCLCGSGNCRGEVTGWKDLPEDIRQQYRGYTAEYLEDI
jgi:SET domain-containing protein